MNHPLSEMMEVTLEKIRAMADANTVIGSPITTPNGVTILPVSKISYGFGSGGGDFPSKTSASPFGGGAGAGVTISPVSFLVIKEDSVRVLPIAEPAANTLDRIIEQIPGLIDRVSTFLEQKKAEKAKDTSNVEVETIANEPDSEN